MSLDKSNTASDRLRVIKDRVIYSNFLAAKTRYDNGLSGKVPRIVGGTGASNEASVSEELAVAIISVTPAEQAAIVSANTPKPPPFDGPGFIIACNDMLGVQVLPSVPTTPYMLSPVAPGVGVAQIQYLDENSNVISTVIIDTTQNTIMSAPPVGTNEIDYAFRCTAAIIDIGVTPSYTTNSWQPLRFQNTTPTTVIVAFTSSLPSPPLARTIAPGETSSAITGIDSYSTSGEFDISAYPTNTTSPVIPYDFKNTFSQAVTIDFMPSSVSSLTVTANTKSGAVTGINSYTTTLALTFDSTASPTTQIAVSPGLALNITASGTDIAIQFYTSDNTLINPPVAAPSGLTTNIIVPVTSAYLTATPAYIYNVSGIDDTSTPFIGAPLLFVNANVLTGSQVIATQYFSGYPQYISDGPHFTSSSFQVALVSEPPGGTVRITYRSG